MLTQFSCPHSSQKGLIILQEGDAAKASGLLSNIKWEWLHDGENVNGTITLDMYRELIAFG